MRTARRFIHRSMATGLIVVAPSFTSLPKLSRTQSIVISHMGPSSVHVERTWGEFRDTVDFTFGHVQGGVHIEGTYRSSKGGELHYRAEVTRDEGYVEISDLQETFTVRLAKQDFRGHAYYKLVSIGFGDKEVAVDEQQLERNLPQLVEIAEGLAQSRMLPLILDSHSLIQGAREKDRSKISENCISHACTRGLGGTELLLGVSGMLPCGGRLCGEYSWDAQLCRPDTRLCPQYFGPSWRCAGFSG